MTGQRQWIASRDALRLVADEYLLHDIVEHASKEIQQRAAMTKAADALMRRLTEATLLARPVWFRFVQGDRENASEHVFHLHEQDRVIDPNFWRTLQRLQDNAARRTSARKPEWPVSRKWHRSKSVCHRTPLARVVCRCQRRCARKQPASRLRKALRDRTERCEAASCQQPRNFRVIGNFWQLVAARAHINA